MARLTDRLYGQTHSQAACAAERGMLAEGALTVLDGSLLAAHAGSFHACKPPGGAVLVSVKA